MIGTLGSSWPPAVARSNCDYPLVRRFDFSLLRFILRSMRFIAARLCSSVG